AGGTTVSLRKAINSKCRDCIHDAAAPGSWRAQVAACPCIRCPLWPYRPAPSVGPLADPPRDPKTVSREWVSMPHGMAVSGHPLTDQGAPLEVVAGHGGSLGGCADLGIQASQEYEA
ncbi:MAG: hypothetical protein ACRD9W_29465, partial [Terriglobia bacterium]